MIWSLGVGALMFSACDNDGATTTTDPLTSTATTTEIEQSGPTAAGEMVVVEPDSVYREKAVIITEKMAEDLELDEDAKAIAEEIFYHQTKRKAEVQQKYAENEFRLNQELINIEEETDQQVLGILTYSQSREYVQNRDEYINVDNSELNRTGTDRSGGKSPDTEMENKEKDGKHQADRNTPDNT